ncbi:hypothetical protein QM996_02575 [Sinorhizobium chiapasense]
MAIQRIDTAEQFDIEYPRCREWLLEALKYSTNNISERDLLNGLIERDYLLWTSENAACVTSLTEWQEKPVCVLFLVGGSRGKAMREILVEGRPVVEDYARDHARVGLLGIGREQWAKVLKPFGFQTEGTIFYKGI